MNGVSSSEAVVDGVREVTDDQVVDSFSSLPDNIITRIFFFLTMKEALGTCILSKKLRHLWTMIPNLEFKEPANDSLGQSVDRKRRELVQIVNRFLIHHEGSIRSFRLSFRPGSYKSDVLHWISVVIRRAVEELDLDFMDQRMPMELPTSHLNFETLKVLKLRACLFNLPSNFAGFSLLKSLLFGDMSISNDLICSVLYHCRLLQSLTLQNCWGFGKIKIADINVPLESLALENCPHFLELDVVNLKTLCFCGERMNFSVVEAVCAENFVIFREAKHLVNQQEAQNMTVNLADKLVNVRSLSLRGWAFKCFAADRLLENMNVASLGIVTLELEMCLWNLRELQGLAWLLRNANGVEELVILINEDLADEGDFANYRDFGDDLVTEDYWKDKSENEFAYGCLNKSLQRIEIKNFTGFDSEVNFIKFVVANSEWLRTMTICPVKEMESNQRLGFANLFLRFPKACRDAKIVVNMVESEV